MKLIMVKLYDVTSQYPGASFIKENIQSNFVFSIFCQQNTPYLKINILNQSLNKTLITEKALIHNFVSF